MKETENTSHFHLLRANTVVITLFAAAKLDKELIIGRKEVLFVDNNVWLLIRPPEREPFPTWKRSAPQVQPWPRYFFGCKNQEVPKKTLHQLFICIRWLQSRPVLLKLTLLKFCFSVPVLNNKIQVCLLSSKNNIHPF